MAPPHPHMMLLGTVTIGSIIFGLLQVLGAVGIFLFGMKVMSEAIQRVAGARLRESMAGLTRNRFAGVVTGMVTTAMVQSSTATTVLTVSFVNAGLLTLHQAIGVIMGANLGTTVTAWIIALVGKFDLAVIALPIIGLGLPFVFLGKNKGKSWGEVLVGFGLLFFGLGLLKGAVPDLNELMKHDPGVAEMIHRIISWMGGHGYLSILIFVVVGVILTLVVQSSAAAVAITITCAVNGWLGDIVQNPIEVFQACAAIVLGENIGTTMTAWLAAMGASVGAKRAACAHFAFNVIGVIWVLVLFYPFSRLVWHLVNFMPAGMRSDPGAPQLAEVSFGTAAFHSAFNLSNMAVLIWFVPQVARLVEWMVKDPKKKEEPPRLQFISQGLVRLGELNLVEAENATRRTSRHVLAMFDLLVELEQPGADLEAGHDRLERMEDECGEMLRDITSYLIQCSAHDLAPSNASKVASILRAVSEYEGVAARIFRLMKIDARKHEKKRTFPDELNAEMEELRALVRSILAISTQALSGVNEQLSTNAQELKAEINRTRKQHNKAAVHRIQNGGKVKMEMLYIEANDHLKAISNHAARIIGISRQTSLVFGPGCS